MAKPATVVTKTLGFRADLPPAILLLGDVFWKIIAAVEHIDFFMSIQEEKFAVMFTFFLSHGWWVVAIVSLGWLILAFKHRKSDPSSKPAFVSVIVVSSVIAFLFGVLLTVRASSSVPQLITEWGLSQDSCYGVVETRQLVGFKDKYRLGLACYAIDPTTDYLEDTHTLFSESYTITGDRTAIVIRLDKATSTYLTSVGGGVNRLAVLIPKDVEMSRIKRLSDITKEGGKILRQGLYQ